LLPVAEIRRPLSPHCYDAIADQKISREMIAGRSESAGRLVETAAAELYRILHGGRQ
jgi:hypothetical protein